MSECTSPTAGRIEQSRHLEASCGVWCQAHMDGESAAERESAFPFVWEGRVVELLRDILTHHGGSFDPAHISHKKMGRGPEDEKVYKELNRLLKPHELRSFVEQHSDFAWQPTGKTGMIVTWAKRT